MPPAHARRSGSSSSSSLAKSSCGLAGASPRGHRTDRHPAESPSATAALLGFDEVLPNSLDAVASRDLMLHLTAAAAVHGTPLSRSRPARGVRLPGRHRRLRSRHRRLVLDHRATAVSASLKAALPAVQSLTGRSPTRRVSRPHGSVDLQTAKGERPVGREVGADHSPHDDWECETRRHNEGIGCARSVIPFEVGVVPATDGDS